MDQDRPVFSLVELIVVIAVMGIFTAIALPHDAPSERWGEPGGESHNEQNIVTTYPAGSAAGVLWRAGDVATKATPVTTGHQPPSGAFSAKMFQSTVMAVATYPFISVPSEGEP